VAVTVVVAVDGATVGVEGAAVGVEGSTAEGETAGVEGGAVVAPEVAVLLVTLPIALWTALPHPATRHPATRMATTRDRPLIAHRMLVLSHAQLASRMIDDSPTAPSGPHPPGRTLPGGTIPAG
jgi:hypothetical protein